MPNDPRKELEELTKKISDLVPEIKKMVFGCKYSVGRDGYIKTYLRDVEPPYYYCGECREGQLTGQAFRNYRCGYCKKTYSHPNLAIPKYCDDCARKHEKCYSCKRSVKILGRDIQLADVLLAINQARSISINYALHDTGEFYSCGIMGDWERSKVFWNFTKPLHQQSPETIDFLHSILCFTDHYLAA